MQSIIAPGVDPYMFSSAILAALSLVMIILYMQQGKTLVAALENQKEHIEGHTVHLVTRYSGTFKLAMCANSDTGASAQDEAIRVCNEINAALEEGSTSWYHITNSLHKDKCGVCLHDVVAIYVR